MSKFLKTPQCLLLFQRHMAKRRYNWPGEGIQYPGFKYYPRTPDFKDPPYEPSKLFRVQRIKPLKGIPYYELKILEEFGLAKQKNVKEIAIIKNIPENNQRLWKVKHWVEIKPITFPDGFPQDTTGTYLQENGELRVRQKWMTSEERLQLTEDLQKKTERLDGDTLRRDSRQKWMTGWQ